MTAPLLGLHVLDFTSALSGPSCTQYLGDLGCDVWKLEVPGKGDDTRGWGPPFMKHTTPPRAEGPDFESSYFTCTNRNKKSITIDLKTEYGREVAFKLAAKADIIVENLLTGKLTGFGLGYDAVKAVNPGVIYCSITGYGQDGSYAKAPGYDAIVAGDAGILHWQVALADHTAGFNAYGAILASLIGRRRSGKGAYLDVSMFDCQVAGLSDAASQWLHRGVDYQRSSTGSSHIVPDQIFQTSDGSVAIAVGTDNEFQLFASALGKPALASDARFKTNQQRLRNRQALEGIISEHLINVTTEEASKALFRKGFAFGRVNNLSSAYAHPQVAARALVSDIPHPHIGTVRLANPPVLYNGERLKTRIAPPILGQHTAEILREELGITQSTL